MTWNDITVYQFQQLAALQEPTTPQEQVAHEVKCISICYGFTEKEIDSMTLNNYRKLLRGMAFLNTVPDWKPVKHIDINGRRYKITYDARKIIAARFMELMTFQADMIPNLHRIAASMVMPQKRGFLGGWTDAKYEAAEHEQYSEDMQAAPITAVYGSAVFFCKVYSASMTSIADYMTRTNQITPTQRKALEAMSSQLANSCSITDGSITVS